MTSPSSPVRSDRNFLRKQTDFPQVERILQRFLTPINWHQNIQARWNDTVYPWQPPSHTGHTPFDKTRFIQIESKHNKKDVTAVLANYFCNSVVPGGGFEPPTRGFSAAMALYYLLITVGFTLINLVCVKVCFWYFSLFWSNTVSWTDDDTKRL